jgi:hypothetical protein
MGPTAGLKEPYPLPYQLSALTEEMNPHGGPKSATKNRCLAAISALLKAEASVVSRSAAVVAVAESANFGLRMPGSKVI